jgi:hypothetical protein
MAEQAACAYLAEYLAGSDVILTAFEHRECADLSRRNRLLHDHLASGWLIQLGWCIVPVSAPAFLNGRLLIDRKVPIMPGITLDPPWRGPRMAV